MEYLVVYREVGNAVIIIVGLVFLAAAGRWLSRFAYPQLLETVRYCATVFRDVMSTLEASRAADRESCRAEREAADIRHAEHIREIFASHERWKEMDQKARHEAQNAAQKVIVDMFFAHKDKEKPGA